MVYFTINPITGQFDELDSPPSGAVVGPGVSTIGDIATWSNITGTALADSGVKISTDGTMASDSDGLVPTQKAVVTYIGTSALSVPASTVPGAYPYAVLGTDYLILADSSAMHTIQLPNAPAAKRVFIIKDNTGTAFTNNITVTTVGGAVTIDGATSQVINQNWGSLTVVFNGTSYRII